MLLLLLFLLDAGATNFAAEFVVVSFFFFPWRCFFFPAAHFLMLLSRIPEAKFALRLVACF